MQVPACRRYSGCANGSRDVLLIAIPVSKPAWLVTNGKSKFVTHWSMRKALSKSRGVDEARDRQRSSSPDSRSGSPRRTERSYRQPSQCRAWQVVRGVRGVRYRDEKSKVSIAAGLAAVTSQTATPVPLVSALQQPAAVVVAAAQGNSLTRSAIRPPTPSATTSAVGISLHQRSLSELRSPCRFGTCNADAVRANERSGHQPGRC